MCNSNWLMSPSEGKTKLTEVKSSEFQQLYSQLPLHDPIDPDTHPLAHGEEAHSSQNAQEQEPETQSEVSSRRRR